MSSRKFGIEVVPLSKNLMRIHRPVTNGGPWNEEGKRKKDQQKPD